ncbi:hypothetical protein CLOM_g1445, partial [Closterium sp. NIES-68]
LFQRQHHSSCSNDACAAATALQHLQESHPSVLQQRHLGTSARQQQQHLSVAAADVSVWDDARGTHFSGSTSPAAATAPLQRRLCCSNSACRRTASLLHALLTTAPRYCRNGTSAAASLQCGYSSSSSRRERVG